jgi:protein TonB
MYPKFISTIVLLMLVLCVHAQKNKESYYLFDSSWKNTTTMENARYFSRVKPSEDSCEQWDTYRVHGPLIRIETYKKDKEGTAEGRFSWYDRNGFIDSLGSFTNGFTDGDWFYYNDTGGVSHVKRFSMGKLLWEKDYSKDTADKKKPKEGEVEAMYKGGIGGWQRFIGKNLQYPQGAMDREIEGNVRIRFMVDVDGTVQEPWVEKSVDFLLDDEALRLIWSSPKWIPGSKDGKKVKAYKIQPINYRLK